MILERIGLCLSAAALFLVPVPSGISQMSQQLREQDRQWESAHRQRDAKLDWETAGPARRPSMALPVDTDNDGMPDTWENDHGFNPNDPKDAWFDRDTDLVVNLFESQLGSDPDNPASPPYVTVAPSGANYSTLETALNSVSPGTAIRVAGGTYTVSYSTFNEKVVMVQGGWNAQFNRRDLGAYPTILDGQRQDEILYFSQRSGRPVIILDGLHFIRGAGNFGAVNLLAADTAFLRASIFNCSFSDSTSSSYGAALSMHGWNASEADRTIANTLIAGNLASGIYSQNTGGAQARWRIINSTISGNVNGGGDNGYGIESFTLDTGVLDVAVFNSVIRGNAQEDVSIRRSITVSADYSDMGTIAAQYGANYQAGPNVINVDPGFLGGGNYRLRENSPCRDTALNQRAPLCDLDGQSRPYPAGGSAAARSA